jgi:hypothetical protein
MTPSVSDVGVARMMGAGLEPAPVATADPRPVVASLVSPAVLTALIADQRLVEATESMPVADTQSGNLFEDRTDPALRWYVPAYQVADPDGAFAFAATQDSVDEHGDPFNRATLTFDLAPVDPPDVAQARAATPDARFQPVTFAGLEATLALPFKSSNGADGATVVAGQVTAQPDGTLQVVATGLLGPQVIQAFENLRRIGRAVLELGITYPVWRHIVKRFPRRPFPMLAAIDRAEIAGLRPVDSDGGDVVVRDHRGQRPPDVDQPLPEDPPPPIDIWTASTARTAQQLPLSLVYAADAYRPKYTIAASGSPARPVIDVNDLRSFDVRRSEYRELTSLGNVQAKYPSFQRLYYGQVTGTVVAIPAAYGIVRGSAGTAARLDALIDDSPTSVSGCRFHFTFTLAPIYAQSDLARLARDLLTTPEAANRSLQVTLPTALDSRDPGTLAGSTATSFAYADAKDEHALLLAVEFTDTKDSPAIVNVNVFLNQLCSSMSAPLFGQVALRLDDVYSPPVRSSVILNLHATSGADDIAVTLAGEPPAPSVTNLSPFALRLRALATYGTDGLTTTPFDQELAAGASLALPVKSDGGAVLVDRELAVPEPLPKAKLFEYLVVDTEQVQESRHAFTINAASVFAGGKITQVDAKVTLNDLPGVDIPALKLTPSHTVDTVVASVPLDAVLEGLGAKLTLTVTPVVSTETRQLEQANDFLEHPIYVLTDVG